MKVTLPNKIDNTLVSARALFAAERAGHSTYVNIRYTRDPPRKVFERQPLIDLPYLQFATGKSYGALKKYQQRKYLDPANLIGTAPLFDVGFVEHLLQTETFAQTEDDLCDEAWVARAFWAWVPRDSLENELGSPADRISQMPFMSDLYDLVNERLQQVAKLRAAEQQNQGDVQTRKIARSR